MVNEMQSVGSSKHTALGKVFLLTSFYRWQGNLATVIKFYTMTYLLM